MSRSRTWNLRLNLDEFNALAASLYADSDRAMALQGMMLGANGGSAPEGVPDSFRRGWELGSSMRQEAVEFQSAQAERGRASASKRRDANGSAQPRKNQPPFEPVVEPPFEPSLEPPFEPVVEPNHNPQSTIQQRTTPPYPPEGDGREVETGETERSVVAAWDAIAPRRGFPDAGPWTDRRRKALRALTPGVGFVEEWAKAVKAMAADQWAKDRALPIDYLLRIENFDRWRSMASRSPEKESRTPIPASARPSDDPAEKAQREANRKALLQFSATKAPRAPDLHQ